MYEARMFLNDVILNRKREKELETKNNKNNGRGFLHKSGKTEVIELND